MTRTDIHRPSQIQPEDYEFVAADPPVLHTRIPEIGRVTGLEYGAHVTLPARGRTGYYVRPVNAEHWGIALMTPASIELLDSDEEIVEAIRDELRA